MIKKIDGIAIAEKIKDEIAKEIFSHQEDRPNLAIILVGNRPDSKMYVSLKQREGKKVGIDTHLYEMDPDIPEEKIIECIQFLNSDPDIDGILVQLPLPSGYDTDRVIASIDPNKDVDGFHPDHPSYLRSPVLSSVAACLEEINFLPAGKKASTLYNSEVFGQSVRKLIESLGMEVLPREDLDKADLVVSALGEPHYIKKSMLKTDAVVIDIGITSQDGKVLGDLDWDEVAEKVSYATPVPGGIGPMTVAFLFKNTLEIFKRKNK